MLIVFKQSSKKSQIPEEWTQSLMPPHCPS